MGVSGDMGDGSVGEEDQGYRWDVSARFWSVMEERLVWFVCRLFRKVQDSRGARGVSLPRIQQSLLLLQFFELVHIKCLIPADVNEDLDTSIKFQ